MRNAPALSSSQQFERLGEFQQQNADLLRRHFEQQQEQLQERERVYEQEQQEQYHPQGGSGSTRSTPSPRQGIPSRRAPQPPNPLTSVTQLPPARQQGDNPIMQHQFLLQKQQQDLRDQFHQLQRQQVAFLCCFD